MSRTVHRYTDISPLLFLSQKTPLWLTASLHSNLGIIDAHLGSLGALPSAYPVEGPMSSVSLSAGWKRSPLVGLFPLFFAPVYLEPTPLCQSRWLHLCQLPRISNYWKVEDGHRRGSICYCSDLGVGESLGTWTKSRSCRWCLSGCSPFASHLLQCFGSFGFNPLILLKFNKAS